MIINYDKYIKELKKIRSEKEILSQNFRLKEMELDNQENAIKDQFYSNVINRNFKKN